jgi:hypothetical protein
MLSMKTGKAFFLMVYVHTDRYGERDRETEREREREREQAEIMRQRHK